jgi:Spy/CpxP family protein refolding chaperone
MNKFAIALAAVVSLGLAVPAFAEEKDDMQMPAGKMHGGKMGMHHDKMMGHHHHHHHMMGKPEPKPQ